MLHDFLSENARIVYNDYPKNIFPICFFWGEGARAAPQRYGRIMMRQQHLYYFLMAHFEVSQ